VVDNGSTDGTAEELARAFPQVIVVQESRPGISIGDNTGGRKSRAPVILSQTTT
jgi:glycosyltransferase involved in cell wall biosynthesis